MQVINLGKELSIFVPFQIEKGKNFQKAFNFLLYHTSKHTQPCEGRPKNTTMHHHHHSSNSCLALFTLHLMQRIYYTAMGAPLCSGSTAEAVYNSPILIAFWAFLFLQFQQQQRLLFCCCNPGFFFMETAGVPSF